MEFAFNLYTAVLPVDKDRLSHQAFVFWLILATGGVFMYLSFAAMSYIFFFRKHKKTFFPKTIDPDDERELRKQVIHEIWIAVCSIPFMGVLMMPAALFAHRGYSKQYHNISDYGWTHFLLSPVYFFAFTDFMVYCFHRGLHHPILYKILHKLHHTYKYTTPFSSHAFNPCDGFGQGVPYYIYTYLFPIHSGLFMFLFVLVNFWTISIHDQVDFGGHFINTTGHHTIHHELFNYDYGQYSTVWDRLGGTYKPAEQTHELSALPASLNDPEYVDPVYKTYHQKKGFLAGRFLKEAGRPLRG
ncbi:lathosterol oxidase [Angomonas deanei]|nr:lathosterol oxidase [Angomonas deanei]EPY39383.1 lathosterol oxidase [Angomonas deanei]EPY40507.1 lathosterol oxidase [Angomonas deanei]|eukprot:EPY25488.1 lathosterol oxidase [Angomonas deanei]